MNRTAAMFSLLLLAACATPTPAVSAKSDPVGMTDDSNALPGHQAVSPNKSYRMGPDADAFDNNPQGQTASKVSAAPSISRNQFLDATSIVTDAVLILTKLF